MIYISTRYIYYTYGLGIDDNCYNNPVSCGAVWLDNYGDSSKSWIYNSNSDNEQSSIRETWHITSSNEDNCLALHTVSDGSYFVNLVDQLLGVRPVLYLNPNTYIIDGDGSSTTPYKIELR